MGNGKTDSLSSSGLLRTAEKTTKDKVGKYISETRRDEILYNLSKIKDKYTASNNTILYSVEAVKMGLPKTIDPAAPKEVAVILGDTTKRIDAVIEKIKKAENKKYEKEVIDSIADSISSKSYGKKVFSAMLSSPLKSLSGLAMVFAGAAQIINEVGTVAAKLKDGIISIPDIVLAGAAIVIVYFGSKILRKTGPAHAYYESIKDKTALK